MDKNTYETYEYLPANNGDSDQFFVVQADGTFLINRQVQYVTQIENVKEVLDGVPSCTVYDVTPQQLLVDVNNSAELISVSDQYVLPDGGSNLYPNSYLVQPGSSASTEQMEENITVDQFKQLDPILNLDVTQNVKETTNCTEITLSDEQYQMLEERGWILLETNDKIYLLDTLGLHDITTNDKLIHKLKTEIESNFEENAEDSRSILLEKNLHTLGNNSIPNKEQTSFSISSDVLVVNPGSIENVPFLRNNNGEIVYNQENHGMNPDVVLSKDKVGNAELKKEETLEQLCEDTATQVLIIENDGIRREGNSLKIKSKLSLKNFPEKIVLGKTLNGKQLVARVVKPNNNVSPMEIDKHEPEQPHLETTNGRKWEIEKNPPAIHLSNLLNETEFLLIIEDLLQNNKNNCCVDDFVSAESVISQLLQIPTFKSIVTESYLVVTKTVQNEDSSGKVINKGITAVITGKVSDSKFGFVHLPYMLQNMINLCILPKSKNGQALDSSKQSLEVLHVQILESKQSGVKVSVTVNRRSIPMDWIAKVHKQLTARVYACSACAALFKTEDLLKEHQMNNCSEPDDILTIDTDEMTQTTYCVVNEGKVKSYECMQCNAKFNKLNSCKNHLKTHVSKAHDNNINETESKPNEVYKCNMCPCTYFHPSTLSKHILSRHIKMKS
ncbi:unnamed protein product [Chilo suppressalis]|uniref:C2H2-type domain-containing protein n=1 Tax=Chilo suppressalis TaxID=168631 RepID=A0ABN8B426_CHISP|nr:unnamed protein product [Chilo suppressalis]